VKSINCLWFCTDTTFGNIFERSLFSLCCVTAAIPITILLMLIMEFDTMGIIRSKYLGAIWSPSFLLFYNVFRIAIFIHTTFGFLKMCIIFCFLTGMYLNCFLDILENLNNLVLRSTRKISCTLHTILNLKWLIITTRLMDLIDRWNMIVMTLIGVEIVLINFLTLRAYNILPVLIYCCLPVIDFCLCVATFMFLYTSHFIDACGQNLLRHLARYSIRRNSQINKQVVSLERICVHMSVMNYKLFCVTRYSSSSWYVAILMHSINALLAFDIVWYTIKFWYHITLSNS